MSRSRTSPDRATISTQRTWLLTALVGVQLWASLSSLPLDRSTGRNLAAEAAALCAVLAVLGLRSLPIRWIVRGAALLSGLLMARFGELGVLGGVGGSWRVLVWLGATAAALALAPSSRAVPGRAPGVVIHAEDVPAPSSTDARPSSGTEGRAGGDRARSVGRGSGAGSVPVALVVAAVALIGASSLLIGPRSAQVFPVGSKAGDIVDLNDNRGDNALVANDTLDMTTRPRLSDEVVMTVRSSIASFWRTETYDRWDGSTWSRSQGPGGSMLEGGQVIAAPEDLAAIEGVPSEQEFRIEVGYATAVPSAPSPSSVDSTLELAQRSDGTLVSPIRPMSRGSTYTVMSRQIPTSPDALRVAGAQPVPQGLLDRYAQPQVVTERTAQLARELTDGLDNTYDKVRALEQWMDDNTEYSLDAPLSPAGVDVVDHFLFESRLGWCEQIASSLVVMARVAGLPARLTTGFAPGEWDPVGGRFVVREREAHAWAEVWFPEVGWVTFDPTAAVPLAGTDEATPGAAAIDWREVAGAVLLVVGLTSLAAGPARRWIRRVGDRRRERRRRRELVRTRWDVAEEQRLEELGRSIGRDRGAAETVSAYAGALAVLVADPEVAERGAVVDRVRYGEPSSGQAERRAATDTTTRDMTTP